MQSILKWRRRFRHSEHSPSDATNDAILQAAETAVQYSSQMRASRGGRIEETRPTGNAKRPATSHCRTASALEHGDREACAKGVGDIGTFVMPDEIDHSARIPRLPTPNEPRRSRSLSQSQNYQTLCNRRCSNDDDSAKSNRMDLSKPGKAQELLPVSTKISARSSSSEPSRPPRSTSCEEQPFTLGTSSGSMRCSTACTTKTAMSSRNDRNHDARAITSERISPHFDLQRTSYQEPDSCISPNLSIASVQFSTTSQHSNSAGCYVAGRQKIVGTQYLQT